MARGMRALEFLERGLGCVVGGHEVEQPLRQQVVGNRVEPLGAFRVAGAHLVEMAFGVGDPGTGHVAFSSGLVAGLAGLRSREDSIRFTPAAKRLELIHFPAFGAP